MDILKDINARGTAILFATHNYDIVKKTEANILKIADGKATKVKLRNKN